MGYVKVAEIKEDIIAGRRNKAGKVYLSRYRKRGRKKVRGTKPNKNKIIVLKKRHGGHKKPFLYKITYTINGVEHGWKKDRKQFLQYADALTIFNELKVENDKVVIPVKYNTEKYLKECDYEVLLLQRNLIEDKQTEFLRDEYGRLCENIVTNNNDWFIIDKFKRNIEETFWIYGYDATKERQNFHFIFEEIIKFELNNEFFQKYIITYNNKLIIRYPDNDIDLIICKCIGDAIRLYNSIKNECDNKKYKNIFFNSGIITRNLRRASPPKIQLSMEDLIKQKTNWILTKIRKNHTAPQKSPIN